MLRQPSRVGHTSDAELWKPTHRVERRRCPRIPPSNTQEPARCHLPLLDLKLSTPGSSSTEVPLGDFGPKPVGCIYNLHASCHTFGDSWLRLPSIGFPITETPSTGVSFVAAWSRLPRRTTYPPLCGYAGCWLEVPSTTGPYDHLELFSRAPFFDPQKSAHYGIIEPYADRARMLPGGILLRAICTKDWELHCVIARDMIFTNVRDNETLSAARLEFIRLVFKRPELPVGGDNV